MELFSFFQKLLLAKAAEDVKQHHATKEVERQRVLAERTVPMPDLDSITSEGTAQYIRALLGSQPWPTLARLDQHPSIRDYSKSSDSPRLTGCGRRPQPVSLGESNGLPYGLVEGCRARRAKLRNSVRIRGWFEILRTTAFCIIQYSTVRFQPN